MGVTPGTFARAARSPRTAWLLALSLAVLLLGSQAAAGAHHHDDGHFRVACSACALAHAPALEATGLPAAPVPDLTPHRPHSAPARAPGASAPRHAPSRAPPRA